MDKANEPDELLDLVNENDVIIGEITKKEANSNPKLLHREIAVLIVDSKNRILFQQRSQKKNVHPLEWTISCAGHIPKGMSPEQAAHKELKEELGFDTELKFIRKVLDKDTNETRFFYCYTGKYNNEPINIEKEEVEQTKFMGKDEFDVFLQSESVITGLSKELAMGFWQNH